MWKIFKCLWCEAWRFCKKSKNRCKDMGFLENSLFSRNYWLARCSFFSSSLLYQRPFPTFEDRLELKRTKKINEVHMNVRAEKMFLSSPSERLTGLIAGKSVEYSCLILIKNLISSNIHLRYLLRNIHTYEEMKISGYKLVKLWCHKSPMDQRRRERERKEIEERAETERGRERVSFETWKKRFLLFFSALQ